MLTDNRHVSFACCVCQWSIPRRNSCRHAFARRPEKNESNDHSFKFLLFELTLPNVNYFISYLDRVEFVDARSRVLRVASECDLERFEEEVHAGEETLRRRGHGLKRRRTVEYDHTIGQIRGHDEIVLDHERRLLAVANVSVRI